MNNPVLIGQRHSLQERLGIQLPAKVAVLRARGLAGLLVAVPALRALRSALPESEITLIGCPGQEGFADRFSYYVDSFLALPGFPGLTPPTQPSSRFISFLAEAQSQSFDLAIQMHGSGTIANALISLLGARRTAGYVLRDHYTPDPDRFLLYPLTDSEVARHLRLMEFLGIPSKGEQLEFPLYQQDWTELQEIYANLALSAFEYGCLEIPPGTLKHQLPLDHWAGLAQGMLSQGLKLVLVGDPEATGTAELLAKSLRGDCANLVGQLPSGTMGALLAQSRLLVCMQGGASNLSRPLGVPTLILHYETGARTFTDPAQSQWEIRWAGTKPVSLLLEEMNQLLSQSV